LEIKETLKDGTKVLVRTLTFDDLDKLMEFYRSLLYEDRKYLKVDVTNRRLIEKRIRAVEEGTAFRIIALNEENIIAIGLLELSTEDWRRGQGELRIVVSREFQRKGLGTIMIRELYMIAVQQKVDKVIAKLMRPQIGPIKICRKFGFREELVIPDYVQDLDKKDQDLVIMICDIKDLWKEIESFYKDSDWQRCR
jgi:L-amino acid N-acyltransferase YncA